MAHIKDLWFFSKNEICHDEWMKLVDRATRWFYMVSYSDLPDLLLTYDAWQSGQTVLDFVKDEVSRVMLEEFGSEEPFRPFPEGEQNAGRTGPHPG